MSDPTSLLPTDPAWIKRFDEVTIQAAKELKCMVVLVALQEDGKTAAGVHGAPESGVLAELAKDFPRLLLTIAGVAVAQDEFARSVPAQ